MRKISFCRSLSMFPKFVAFITNGVHKTNFFIPLLTTFPRQILFHTNEKLGKKTDIYIDESEKSTKKSGPRTFRFLSAWQYPWIYSSTISLNSLHVSFDRGWHTSAGHHKNIQLQTQLYITISNTIFFHISEHPEKRSPPQKKNFVRS